uniref:hypothetical protein n=1 Tax=Comamonas thiooxydans TaxID=363952 RepID=UPI00325FBFA0
KKKVPAQEVREPLVVRYYEEGLARFEHFWAVPTRPAPVAPSAPIAPAATRAMTNRRGVERIVFMVILSKKHRIGVVEGKFERPHLGET